MSLLLCIEISLRLSDCVFYNDTAATENYTHGFGSVRVEATIGGSTWRTSIFPSDDAYILPIKKAVREAEGLELDAPVVGKVRLVDL